MTAYSHNNLRRKKSRLSKGVIEKCGKNCSCNYVIPSFNVSINSGPKAGLHQILFRISKIFTATSVNFSLLSFQFPSCVNPGCNLYALRVLKFDTNSQHLFCILEGNVEGTISLTGF